MSRPQQGPGHAADLARAMGEGWQARDAGQPKDDCPYGATDARLRSGWLCGWNERDQYLGVLCL